MRVRMLVKISGGRGDGTEGNWKLWKDAYTSLG